ncbi:SET domain-containing protein 5 [Colletotrichum tanaceti]|uniref:SET domain-containing protein 5 n=1 Tax=Colletotrichum tanaceti TaxID=1306861 RepID=A0A4U6WYE8_9PEZI|nr:SET domain-containing protein 5 [Colletotrichum tanaceti]TKW48232.1 SET domain-containing protein 5 [Colletotrichum tanaceti]
MKPSLLLLGAGSPVLAFRDSKIISSSSSEMCISSQLLAASSSNPICRSKDGADLLSGRGRGSGDQFSLAGSVPAPSPTSPDPSWTHVTHCFKNSTDSPDFCIFHAANYGGKGISVITDAERATHIGRNWGFTRPKELEGANRPIPKFEVAEVPGKGYGLVATRPIRRGEVILRESASMLIDYAAFMHVPMSQMKKLQAHGIDLLPFHHRSQWLNMSSHGFQGDHLSMVDKILITNSFDVEMDDAMRDDDFYAVFVNTSRMNHDCRPNIDYWFDPRTLTQRTTAIRDIIPGEELTLSYIDPMQTRADRRERLLTTWGFNCSCNHCMQHRLLTDESDRRIEQIASLREEFNDYTPASRATPQMAELLISLYKQENNWSILSEAYTLAAIEYNGVGEPWLATKYARLAVEYGLLTLWEGHGDVVEMTKLAEDPWAHWSWMLRTRKRYSWGSGSKPNQAEDEEEGEE